MRGARTSDLAIMLGHALQCEECRQRLLAEPSRIIIGRKLSADERERVLGLTDTDFENSQRLAAAASLTSAELAEGAEHPRARLRHL